MAGSCPVAMILLFCFGILSAIPVHGEVASEIAALFALQVAIADTNPMIWGANLNYCYWQGVSCSSGAVSAIQLPRQGLYGQIPEGTIGNLRHLKLLDLSVNLLSGPLPDDLANCHMLTVLNMQQNFLSGSLPADLSVWPNLQVMDLSYNKLIGFIPYSITSLTKLVGLLLQNNSLTGLLPQMDAATLLHFSVANNHLNGSISDDLLAKFSNASFSGNSFCGPPFATPCFTNSTLPPSPFTLLPSLFPSTEVNNSTPPRQAPHIPVKKLGVGLIIVMVIGDTIVVVMLPLLMFYACRKVGKRYSDNGVKSESSLDSSSTSNKRGSSKDASSPSGGPVGVDGSTLVFVENTGYRFTVEDLLEASAKALGQGCTGSSYRAVLEDRSIVVVKLLKVVCNKQEELEAHLHLLHRLHHPNLLLPRGYLYTNHVILLVYDYFGSGSLSTLLHGNKRAGRTPLDWVTCVQIVLGAARGISYLHDLGLVHGNIKSTNVLIKNKYSGYVSDFGLTHLLSPSVAVASRNVGYRAPETLNTRIVTQQADVYSFGVLLLELLTGKAPMPTSLNDEGMNLPHWVQSVVNEEWTTDIFDQELIKYQNIVDEMMEMLQVAMGCIAPIPDKRPQMNQVIVMLEGIRPVNFLDESEEVSTDLSSLSSFHNSTSYVPTSISDISESMTDFTFDQIYEGDPEIGMFSSSFV